MVWSRELVLPLREEKLRSHLEVVKENQEEVVQWV